MIYLASYHPLIETKAGRDAIARYEFLPFVEGSCRREPDLGNAYPSITALGLGPRLAPKLQPEDTVVWITARGEYPELGQGLWRLTAILRVLERFESHEEAAEWYQGRDLPLPSNCMVEGNDPLPLDQTQGYCHLDGKKRRPRYIEEWDEQYAERARQYPVFLVCEALYRELRRPRAITEADARAVFGEKGLPNTLTPPTLTEEQLEGLKQACYIRT
jgi:hypothetical protein